MFGNQHDLLALQETMVASSQDRMLTCSKKLVEFDQAVTVSAIAGVLLMPEFRASTYRLEKLVQSASLMCRGKKAPRVKDLASLITDAGKAVGNAEDPAEDAFFGIVLFEGKNYRVLQGIFEGNCYHLQIILRIVEKMPTSFSKLKDSCRSLLTLSDIACDRAKIFKHEALGEFPHRSRIKPSQFPPVKELISWVSFSQGDLYSSNISHSSLDSFCFKETKALPASKIPKNEAQLEKPLLKIKDNIVLAIPTAVGPAIRTAVINFCRSLGGQAEIILKMQNLQIATESLSHVPLINSISREPIALSLDSIIPSEPVEIESGYWTQIILVTDDLRGFEENGLLGQSSHGTHAINLLNNEISKARRKCEHAPGFKAGLTLVVFCGFGRSEMIGFADHGDSWYIQTASAYDTEVFGWRDDFSIRDLFRISMAERDLSERGFEFHNVNGLLALIGTAIENKGHLIAHESLPEGMPGGLMMMPTNGQLKLRIEHQRRTDRQYISAPDGGFIEVVRADPQSRSQDIKLFTSINDVLDGRLRATWILGAKNWWFETKPLSSDSLQPSIGMFEALRTWTRRIAPVLSSFIPNLPDQMIWEVKIDPQRNFSVENLAPANYQEVKSSISTEYHVESNRISMKISDAFWRGLSNSNNVAESTLVEEFILCVVANISNKEINTTQLLQQIVQSPNARQLHAFVPQDFRDLIRQHVPKKPTRISPIQDAALRIGLGWNGVARPGGTIKGVKECVACLNAITVAAEDLLISDLSRFNRKQLILAATQNHEAAECDKRLWKRSAGAQIALSTDEAETRSHIATQIFEMNGISLASRILIEVGLHECPEDSGLDVAQIDLARLMARSLIITSLGGYSDAIQYGGMRPEVRISPAGEVLIDVSFFDSIMDPVGQEFTNRQVDFSSLNYSNFVSLMNTTEDSPKQTPDEEFMIAWKEEFGAPLSSFTKILEVFEDLCLKKDVPWLVVPRSDLLQHLEMEIPDASIVLASLESTPRSSWKTIPSGFTDADRQPWRYRRRLSVPRRPIISLHESKSSEVLIAPGLIREGFISTFSNMIEGNYDDHQISSRAMRLWSKKTSNKMGLEFERKVCIKLQELGWKVEAGIKFGKILGRNPEKNPGDIDVLAWREDGRIVLLECKRLQFAKTVSENAKQLTKFRGLHDEKGRPDRLAKHISRLELARNNAASFSKFTKLSNPSIEAGLVFSGTVPMKFASDRMSEKLWVDTIDNLHLL